jgi:methylated-DNA-[protein]-cysteine S-methyltransferase
MNSFSTTVLNKVKNIPKGKVTTYKILADKIGHPKAYRAVGNGLNKNYNLVKIPCHRVVRVDGKVGGYKIGAKRKIYLLKKEGIEIDKNGVIKNLKKFLYKF